MTTPEAEPQTPPTHGETELAAQQPGQTPVAPDQAAPSPESEPSTATEPDEALLAPAPVIAEATRPIATVRPVAPTERELVYVPLAVNIGDGFKFGCGFFLAMVLAMLVGFVVLAALFVLTGLFGLNLPLTR
ncbi:MAG: hypothetical protein JOZ65_14480 [Chloroflexi bacterium]|nr:hypothetical protein [Chloroflexota bacterium]